MLHYENEINRALENAPIITPDAHTLLPSPPDGVNGYPSIKEFSDCDLVYFNMDPNAWDIAPNQIVVPKLRNLKTLLGEFALLTGAASPEDSQRDIEHEAEHATVSEALRARRTGFSLTVAKTKYGGIAWQLAHQASMKTTKLGVAAMIAQPRGPSRGDMDDIHTMGYDGGVDEVGYKITARNKRMWLRHKIPVPLSYKPRTAQIIDLAKPSAR